MSFSQQRVERKIARTVHDRHRNAQYAAELQHHPIGWGANQCFLMVELRSLQLCLEAGDRCVDRVDQAGATTTSTSALDRASAKSLGGGESVTIISIAL